MYYSVYIMRFFLFVFFCFYFFFFFSWKRQNRRIFHDLLLWFLAWSKLSLFSLHGTVQFTKFTVRMIEWLVFIDSCIGIKIKFSLKCIEVMILDRTLLDFSGDGSSWTFLEVPIKRYFFISRNSSLFVTSKLSKC